MCCLPHCLLLGSKLNVQQLKDYYGTDFQADGSRWEEGFMLNYVPPSKEVRLKDTDGKTLRNSAEKGFDIFARFILGHTSINDAIFEPFGGSAAGGIAAITLGRRWYSTEAVSIGKFLCSFIRFALLLHFVIYSCKST